MLKLQVTLVVELVDQFYICDKSCYNGSHFEIQNEQTLVHVLISFDTLETNISIILMW